MIEPEPLYAIEFTATEINAIVAALRSARFSGTGEQLDAMERHTQTLRGLFAKIERVVTAAQGEGAKGSQTEKDIE
jgi:hypothetical protein